MRFEHGSRQVRQAGLCGGDFCGHHLAGINLAQAHADQRKETHARPRGKGLNPEREKLRHDRQRDENEDGRDDQQDDEKDLPARRRRSLRKDRKEMVHGTPGR